MNKAAYTALPCHALDSPYIERWRSRVHMAVSLPEMNLASVPDSWLSDKPQPIPYLVDALIPRGIVALVQGDSGLGKTFFLTWLAMCVASGKRFMGLPVEKGRVVYCSLEDPRDPVLKNRIHYIAKKQGFEAGTLKNLAMDDSFVGRQVHLLKMQSGSIGHSTALTALVDRLKRERPALVILDPIARLHGLPENPEVFNVLVTAAERLSREVGCNVILTHHVSKDAAGRGRTDQHAGRGGSSLPAGSRAVLTLTRVEAGILPGGVVITKDDARVGVLKLTHAKNSYGPTYREVFLKRAEHGVLEVFTPGEANDDEWIQKLRAWATKRKGDPFTRRNVTDAKDEMGGGSRESVEALFERAVTTGDVMPTGEKRRGGALYLLTQSKGTKKR